jgi:hypothetical protein
MAALSTTAACWTARNATPAARSKYRDWELTMEYRA